MYMNVYYILILNTFIRAKIVNKKLLILGIILTVAEAALVLNMFYPAMSASQSKGPKKPVPSRGSIKGINIGLYSDQACTTPLESIQWGMLEPGATTNQTAYIRNEGDTNTTLTMIVSNWKPTNSSNHIGLNWNYNGQILAVNRVIQITFILRISENIQGITNFSFDITIA
jgi:hypothetical protein